MVEIIVGSKETSNTFLFFPFHKRAPERVHPPMAKWHMYCVI